MENGGEKMFDIKYALREARKYYDDETFYHVMRVTGYVLQNESIPKDKLDNCVILAIMHDLLEDTNFEFPIDSATDDNEWYINDCLELLTMDKEKNTYEDYLKNIKSKFISYPEAYWVKMADMKDHLMQRDTLTDKLKDKYLAAIPYLL
jgi:hypothetical protein